MEEHFVAKRFFNIVLMGLTTLVFTLALCIKEGIWIDQAICLFLLDVVFFLLFLFVLEHNRFFKIISHNRETNYRKVFYGYGILALITFGCSFLPEFVKPVLILPLIMTAFCNQELAFCSSVFFTCILAVASNMSNLELISAIIMILSGCMLAKAMEDRKWRLWCGIIILCLSILVPVLFFYLHYNESNFGIMVWGGLWGIIIDLLLLLFDDKMITFRDTEVDTMLVDMLEEDYPLVLELKNFSRKEYQHAKKVSEISRRCAKIVAANEEICAAAAFYYRIGILEGDAIAENGTNIAIKNCFPEEVTTIISEYYGEKHALSTIESAIVQMVDCLIKKLEVLDQTTMSSNWNQDMVIYQTLNEYSASGMYDQSGLSMNMFLKIREYLVNEEGLL